MTKLNVLITMAATLLMNGCMASGSYSVGIPVADADCTVGDADQIRIDYSNSFVPAYLTVSINNDQFVFDECAPDAAQGSQGDFHVTRSSDTEVTIGLPSASTLRDAYFPAYTGSSPSRSDMVVKIMGRSDCYSAPYTILPATAVLLAWQPVSASVGLCRANGWDGSASIN